MAHRCSCFISESERGWTYCCCCGAVRGPFAYVEVARNSLDNHHAVGHQHVVVLRPMPGPGAEVLPFP